MIEDKQTEEAIIALLSKNESLLSCSFALFGKYNLSDGNSRHFLYKKDEPALIVGERSYCVAISFGKLSLKLIAAVDKEKHRLDLYPKYSAFIKQDADQKEILVAPLVGAICLFGDYSYCLHEKELIRVETIKGRGVYVYKAHGSIFGLLDFREPFLLDCNFSQDFPSDLIESETLKLILSLLKII